MTEMLDKWMMGGGVKSGRRNAHPYTPAFSEVRMMVEAVQRYSNFELNILRRLLRVIPSCQID